MASQTPTEVELLTTLIEKIDVLIGLSISAGRDQDAQITLLRKLGYGNKFIGPIVGLAPNAVNMRAARMKRGRRTAAKGKSR